jgi:dipeptidyl-peptidase 4
MHHSRPLTLLVIALTASCTSIDVPPSSGDRAWSPPRTAAELSRYQRTSTAAEVESFTASCVAAAPDVLTRLSMGRSTEGRDLCLILAADPPVRTLDEAVRDGRPVALVMANIHAGEVEGKEAVQEILREIAGGGHRDLLRGAITAFVPNYNPDGNERVDRRHRPDQAGPVEGVGSRPNAAGLDLNRDYVKVEAPETEALIRAVRALNALLVIDCHTTDGSYHGYDLTYAGPLHPGTDPAILSFERQRLLPAVRARMASAGFATFDYGNWVDEGDPRQGWASFEPLPRFGNSYFGLRNRLTLLSEAYSHDPFEKRIAATKALVLSGLIEFARRGAEIAALCRNADADAARAGAEAKRWPTRTEPAYTGMEPVPVGSIREEKDPVTGLIRQWDTNVSVPVVMPVYLHFDGTAARPVPRVGWAVRRPSARFLKLLDVHGIVHERVLDPRRVTARVFLVNAKRASKSPFQGSRLTVFSGRDRVEAAELPPGAVLVRTAQPAARLAFILLEPESEDGLGTWGVLGVEPGADGGEVFEAIRVEEE